MNLVYVLVPFFKIDAQDHIVIFKLIFSKDRPNNNWEFSMNNNRKTLSYMRFKKTNLLYKSPISV